MSEYSKVYIRGDVHANFEEFSLRRWPASYDLDENDWVIVCGDFGIWSDNKCERYWLDWLEEKKYNILFVDGNHENFDRLYSDEFPVVELLGGRAQKIRKNIFHALRGEIYTINEKKFFCLGGAASHDIQDGILDPDEFDDVEKFKEVKHRWLWDGKMFRVKGTEWWPQELPNWDELDYAWENLERHNFKVDYIITHCAPTSTENIMYGGQNQDRNYFTDFLDKIKWNTEFRKWYFGHHHVNMWNIEPNMNCLYGVFERVE